MDGADDHDHNSDNDRADDHDNDNDLLTLTLATRGQNPNSATANTSSSPPQQPPSNLKHPSLLSRSVPPPANAPNARPRLNANIAPINPPYPWSTNLRAKVRTLDQLLTNSIHSITGDVKCKSCQLHTVVTYDLRAEFDRMARYLEERVGTMHSRAPQEWMDPVLVDCPGCKQANCLMPVLVDVKKKAINWLFLFLGRMIGICTLKNLKYFCKHTNNHRTGSKDRLVYITYLSIYNQLHPTGAYTIS